MSRITIRRTLSPLVLALAASACAIDTPTDSYVEAGGPAAAHGPTDAMTPEVHRWLGQLRGALAPYHSFATAEKAGWDTDITGCMEENGAGMGHHYANLGLLDGAVDPLAPEALLYEPQKNGRMRLVGVEYIIPFAILPDTEPAPVIHGIEMMRNYRFNVWALHAWIFEHNPDGMFANWNPRITCTYAS